MTFKAFIQLTLISTVVTWGIWLFLLLTIDPVFAGLFEFSLFYVTLFIALVGTLLSIAVPIRVKVKPDIILFRHVATSFRQSLLFSLLFVSALFLLSKAIFTWWSLLILVFLFTLIEWNAQSLNRRKGLNEHNNDSDSSL